MKLIGFHWLRRQTSKISFETVCRYSMSETLNRDRSPNVAYLFTKHVPLGHRPGRAYVSNLDALFPRKFLCSTTEPNSTTQCEGDEPAATKTLNRFSGNRSNNCSFDPSKPIPDPRVHIRSPTSARRQQRRRSRISNYLRPGQWMTNKLDAFWIFLLGKKSIRLASARFRIYKFCWRSEDVFACIVRVCLL